MQMFEKEIKNENRDVFRFHVQGNEKIKNKVNLSVKYYNKFIDF